MQPLLPDAAMESPAIPPLPEVETERLLLRALRESDADALFAMFSDWEVMRYWSRGPWTDRGEALEHIARMNQGRANVEYYPWAIATQGDDALIGTMSLFDIQREHGRAQVGYSLLPSQQGKGYATEALRAALHVAFEALGLQRIEIDIDPANVTSRRLVERCGAKLEGHFRRRWFVHGQWADSVMYGLLREDFVAA